MKKLIIWLREVRANSGDLFSGLLIQRVVEEVVGLAQFQENPQYQLFPLHAL
jgi:hypothetical protein